MDFHKLNNLPYKSRHDDYITYHNTQDFHRDINTNTKRKRFADSMVAFSVDSGFRYHQAIRDVSLKYLTTSFADQ